MNDIVYLLWDNSRAEHGEEPTLIDVYATIQAAEQDIERITWGDDGDLDIEPWTVRR